MLSRRKPDQSAPRPASPTGVTNGQSPNPDPRAQSADFLTTAHGLRQPDTDHSLKAGARGPTRLESAVLPASPSLHQRIAKDNSES